jgi:hypothetical protein
VIKIGTDGTILLFFFSLRLESIYISLFWRSFAKIYLFFNARALKFITTFGGSIAKRRLQFL